MEAVKEMTLAKKLMSKGIKKLSQRLPNPLKLRPEILLHPNIPKPLHGVNPRTINGKNWWDRERRKVYKSTEFHCLACGVHKDDALNRKWLEAHEIYEVDYKKGTAKFIEAVPLCHYCHNYIHDGRLTDLLKRGEIHSAKFASIIKHGDRVLAKAGMKKPTKLERDTAVLNMELGGQLAEWSSWRLIIGRKKYKPLFASYDEWQEAYAENSIPESDQ